MSDQPSGQPRKPADPTPQEGTPVDANPDGRSPNGIPDELKDHEATGTPNSDRQHTETTPSRQP